MASQSDPAWPPEAEAVYSRVRALGSGAYGTVWLAKSKEEKALPRDEKQGEGEDYVALKVIRTDNDKEAVYAAREIDILSELRHPNIVRFLRTFDLPDGGSGRLCAMSLAYGPNLHSLLQAGGAFGVPLARLVSRHLVSAVGYLQGRGVIHRDIKPANCVLVRTDASPENSDPNDALDDDNVWSDGAEARAAVDAGKYRLVLVDFGFARALRKSDVELKEGKGAANDGESVNTPPPPVPARRIGSTRGSVVFRFSRNMSAIGTRAFAAPEVKDDPRNRTKSERQGESAILGESVSHYGLLSDSYSVGVTLREVLTGVPAFETDIAAYISSKENPLGKSLSALFSCAGGNKKGQRKKRYRYVDQVPKAAAEMVRALTEAKESDRLTVREAQIRPWITGEDEGEVGYDIPRGDIPSHHGDPIVFLKCAGSEKDEPGEKVSGQMTETSE